MTAAALVRDLAAFSIQVALVVLAVALLTKLVHIPARTRYHGLRLVLVASLLAPWLLRSSEAPPAAQTMTRPAASVILTPVGAIPDAPSPSPTMAASATRLPEIPWTGIIIAVALLGVVGRALWLAIGLNRLRRLTQAGTAVEDPEYAQLQEQIGARATIAQVIGLAQPATFGVRRPVVMLPDTLADAPAPLRRAVVIHELFHVRRRDWLFVLAEEAVCTVFWFHPAILWLTSHIQLAREEIVDELTVRATGDRRGYMQALLAFADSGGLSPAPAFARRRQLFHRILSVSKEKVMSRPRIVLSAVVLVAVVFAASWSASSLFPIVRAGSATFAPTSLSAVQDARAAAPVRLFAPTVLQAPPARSRLVLLDQQTGAAVTPRQVTPENPIPRRTRGVSVPWPTQFAGRQFHVLVQTLVTLDRNGAVTAVERGRCQIAERPAVGEQNDAVCSAFFDVSANAIRQWRYERPAQAPLQFTVLSTFVPGSEPAITQAGSDLQRYIRETPESLRELSERQGVAGSTVDFLRAQLAELTNKYREVERAYAKGSQLYAPGHPDMVQLQRELALVNDEMARLQEKLREPNVASQAQRSVAQAQLEQAQAQLEASRRQPESAVTADVRPSQVEGTSPLRSPSGRTPVRVGTGGVTAPRVLKTVKAQHSVEAMQARLQGTVVVAALVDEQGRVADARVVRSVPLLDESALTAVKQWEFAPALLNGEPVPVVVQLEIHFTLK